MTDHSQLNLERSLHNTYCKCASRNTHMELQTEKLEMWANAQRDGRPAEYRWRPLFNATKFG